MLKPLSRRASELLARLQRRDSWRERILGRVDDEARVLADLAECAELALVPQITALVFGGPAAVRRAAATVLDRALSAATPTDVLHLDVACRRLGSAYDAAWENSWRTLKPIQLSGLDALGPLELSVLGVASLHANGYVREAAIARLDTWSDGRELAFLLVRLNDWVPAVAKAARIAVARRIVPAYAAAWLTGLPLLHRLGTHTRRSPGDLTEQVSDMLRAPEQRAVLRAGLSSGNGSIRRAAFRLLRGARSAEDEGVDIVATALRDLDPVVRVEAVAYAREQLSDSELEGLIPLILADPCPPVRREGLTAAAERLGVRANRWLMASLLDRGAAVRELARYHLHRRGALTDPAAYYRGQLDALGPSSCLAQAVAGLGETGTRADATLLVPLLTHERAGVRRTATRAVGWLDVEGQQSRLLSLLDDPAPGVTHAARDALRERAASLDTAAVRRAVQHAAHAHGRLDALVLSAGLSKWESISLLLEQVADTDERMRGDASERITLWLARQNESSLPPSEDQLTAFSTALQANGEVLAPKERRALSSVLSYWAAHRVG